MHETNENTPEEFGTTDKLDRVIEGLEILNETLMACMVQLSRLYDVAATDFHMERGARSETLLDSHEKGDIFTTAPVLRSFGAPEDEPFTEKPEDDEEVSDDNKE